MIFTTDINAIGIYIASQKCWICRKCILSCILRHIHPLIIIIMLLEFYGKISNHESHKTARAADCSWVGVALWVSGHRLLRARCQFLSRSARRHFDMGFNDPWNEWPDSVTRAVIRWRIRQQGQWPWESVWKSRGRAIRWTYAEVTAYWEIFISPLEMFFCV